MSGGLRVAQVLEAHGVEHLFTLCGGHISPILVEAKKLGIRIVDVRHEVNAVFAADAVARLTGRPGVAAVTAGPGVSNDNGHQERTVGAISLVLIGGATATILRGRVVARHRSNGVDWPACEMGSPSQQTQAGGPDLGRGISHCHGWCAGSGIRELAVDLLYEEQTVREWYAAKTERPNKNLAEHVQAFYIKNHLNRTFGEGEAPTVTPPPELRPAKAGKGQLQRALSLLTEAEKPLMVLGSQVMLWPERAKELVDALEQLNIPVYLSGMARDC